jgi:hypothetical protein
VQASPAGAASLDAAESDEPEEPHAASKSVPAATAIRAPVTLR